MHKWDRINGVEVATDDESNGVKAQTDKTEVEAAKSEGDNNGTG